MTRLCRDGDPLPKMHFARPEKYWCGDGLGVPACRSPSSAATSDVTHIKECVDCAACKRTRQFKSAAPFSAHECAQCERKPAARAAVRAGSEVPVPGIGLVRTAIADPEPTTIECGTCLGHRTIRDGDTNRLRKCLDCNGMGQVPNRRAW